MAANTARFAKPDDEVDALVPGGSGGGGSPPPTEVDFITIQAATAVWSPGLDALSFEVTYRPTGTTDALPWTWPLQIDWNNNSNTSPVLATPDAGGRFSHTYTTPRVSGTQQAVWAGIPADMNNGNGRFINVP